MAKGSMKGFARGWKTPEERADMKKRNSADSKGASATGFTKGVTKRPAAMKGCGK